MRTTVKERHQGRQVYTPLRMIPHLSKKTIIPLFYFAAFLIVLEVITQVYVGIVLKKGRLFEAHPILGWRAIPNLDRVRINSDGKMWHVKTNESGYRSPRWWDDNAQRRILILGDSFAFGEGVNAEDRFDTLISRNRPSWSFVNLGTMGYGTDQELIAGREFFSGLRKGDALLILTYQNDFYDLLRHSFAGRAKPWFAYENGSLTEHPPKLGIRETFRDRSYLMARIASIFERDQNQYSVEELRKGAELFDALISNQAETLAKSGIIVLIAYFGMDELSHKAGTGATTVELAINRLCLHDNPICLNLDAALGQTKSGTGNFLKDGHWNENGHLVVAKALSSRLNTLLQ